MQNGDGGCIQCLCMCVRLCSCLDAGSPFNVNVIDPSKATARGDGLDMVQCNQTTSFFVSAPSAQLNEFDVKIIGNCSSNSNKIIIMFVFYSCSQNATTEPTSVTQDSTDTIERKASI